MQARTDVLLQSLCVMDRTERQGCGGVRQRVAARDGVRVEARVPIAALPADGQLVRACMSSASDNHELDLVDPGRQPEGAHGASPAEASTRRTSAGADPAPAIHRLHTLRRSESAPSLPDAKSRSRDLGGRDGEAAARRDRGRLTVTKRIKTAIRNIAARTSRARPSPRGDDQDGHDLQLSAAPRSTNLMELLGRGGMVQHGARGALSSAGTSS
jgi:hypothetical protein